MRKSEIFFVPRWEYFKAIISYALPICITNLLGIASTTLITLFLARKGAQVLAAFALANSYYTLIAASAGAFISAVSIMISNQKNLLSFHQLSQLLATSLGLSILLGVISSGLMYLGGYFLVLSGQQPSLVAACRGFFQIAALSMIPNLVATALLQFFIGVGKPSVSSIFTLLKLIIVSCCGPSIIIGKLVANLSSSITGVAVTLLLSQVLGLIAILLYFRYNRYFPILCQALHQRINLRQLWHLCQLGAPISLQLIGELGALTIITWLMGHYGNLALAGAQIINQYSTCLAIVSLGLSQALAVRTSQAYGQKSLWQIINYTHAALILVGVGWCGFTLCYLLAPVWFIQLFLSPQDQGNLALLRLCHSLMLVAQLSLAADSIKNIVTASLRGMHNSRTPMLIGNSCIWLISLPLCYQLTFNTSVGPVGLRVGYSCGFIAAALILAWYYFNFSQRLVRAPLASPTRILNLEYQPLNSNANPDRLVN